MTTAQQPRSRLALILPGYFANEKRKNRYYSPLNQL